MFYRAMLKKENARKQGKKAFTLIELIVVIAIIGVLIAILVPTMMGFVTQAEDQARLANARTVYSAATAAAADLQAKGEKVEQAGVEDGMVDLLGDQFVDDKGAKKYTVKVTDGVIEEVTYTDANGKATYPVPPTTPNP